MKTAHNLWMHPKGITASLQGFHTERAIDAEGCIIGFQCRKVMFANHIHVISPLQEEKSGYVWSQYSYQNLPPNWNCSAFMAEQGHTHSEKMLHMLSLISLAGTSLSHRWKLGLVTVSKITRIWKQSTFWYNNYQIGFLLLVPFLVGTTPLPGSKAWKYTNHQMF